MTTKLARIAEIAKANQKETFTSLYHLLNEEMLINCCKELGRNKAAGIDGITKKQYEENLDSNVSSLVDRLKNKAYHPQPVRRVNIPKGNGNELRPLGIPAFEDKILQLGLNKILLKIYENDFLDCSYGFRANRGCHDALKKLNEIVLFGKTNYIVDADIKGFFNNVDHEWLMKFISLRIADTNIKRLIKRFLKAGVVENHRFEPTEKGTPQGSVISPTLANIYLHYSLDLWFEKIVKARCKGQAELVRYADDFVCCFQYKEEAEKFYQALIERMAKFKLELAVEKSKIIEFGRFAASNRAERGLGKPETFNFLGFTHYCSKSKSGKFRVKRKTSKKKLNMKLKSFNNWMKSAKDCKSMGEIFERVRATLRGHFQYYGITDNTKAIASFKYKIIKIMFKWFNRRSQRRSFTWDKFKEYLKINKLPNPKVHVNI